MDRRPVSPRKRHILESMIRGVDIFVYLAVFVGGLYALTVPPHSVIDSLQHYAWLAIFWAWLLLIGGAIGFIGRLTRYWLMEAPATIASATGIGIYVVVLTEYTFISITAGVATLLAIIAMAFMIRRHLELQVFATEPRTRVIDALHRRTKDAVKLY